MRRLAALVIGVVLASVLGIATVEQSDSRQWSEWPASAGPTRDGPSEAQPSRSEDPADCAFVQLGLFSEMEDSSDTSSPDDLTRPSDPRLPAAQRLKAPRLEVQTSAHARFALTRERSPPAA